MTATSRWRCWCSAARQRPATRSISPYRSSWSRKRLVRTTARGRRNSQTTGSVASSTSKMPIPRGRRARQLAWETRAVMIPVAKFAPARLWTEGVPARWRTWLMRREVVVFPLVPVTITQPSDKRAARSRMTVGAIARAVRPGIVVPPPRCRARLAAAVTLPRMTARARRRLTNITFVLFLRPYVCSLMLIEHTAVPETVLHSSGYRWPAVGIWTVTAPLFDAWGDCVYNKAATRRVSRDTHEGTGSRTRPADESSRPAG